MVTFVRISIEAAVIGALLLGLFNLEYEGNAPLPAALAAVVAIILALVIDYFLFGRRRNRKA